jgi:hypothetical protein
MTGLREKAASGFLAAKVAADVVTGGSSQTEQLAHAMQSQAEERMEQTSEASAAQAPAVQVQEPPTH